MVDILSYFSFQPVFHDSCNKGRGMRHKTNQGYMNKYTLAVLFVLYLYICVNKRMCRCIKRIHF